MSTVVEIVNCSYALDKSMHYTVLRILFSEVVFADGANLSLAMAFLNCHLFILWFKTGLNSSATIRRMHAHPINAKC